MRIFDVFCMCYECNILIALDSDVVPLNHKDVSLLDVVTLSQ
jgi:hypothetical protein